MSVDLAFYEAVANNNYDAAKGILNGDKKPNLNYQPSDEECSPLFIATTNNNIPMMKLILDAKVEYIKVKQEQVNQPDTKKNVELLTVDINKLCGDFFGTKTPLMEASSKGFYEAAMLLLDHGADVNIIDSEGSTAINWLAPPIRMSERNPPIFYTLLKRINDLSTTKISLNEYATKEKYYTPELAPDLPSNFDPKDATLSGPVSFHIMCNSERIIYMFGDIHTYSEDIDCGKYTHKTSVYLPKFLKKLFLDANNQKSAIDVFLETGFNAAGESTNIADVSSGLFNSFGKEFRNCLANLRSEERNKCKELYNKTRFHHADFRQFVKNTGYSQGSDDVSIMLNNMLVAFYNNDRDKLSSEFAKFLKSTKEEDYGEIIWKYVMSYPKISSQYTNISNQNTRELLKKYFINQGSKLSTIELPGLPKYKLSEVYIGTASSHFTTEFSLLIMDIYLISRLLRTFKEGTPYGHSIEQTETKRCIIIAGDQHINNYIKFFTQLDYQVVYSMRSPINFEKMKNNQTQEKCINISDIPREFLESCSAIKDFHAQKLSVRDVDLSYYRFSGPLTEYTYVISVIGKNTSIENLNLSNNNCENDALEALLAAIKGKKALKFINLSNANINDTMAEMVIRFSRNKPDVSIDLTHNESLSASIKSKIEKEKNIKYSEVIPKVSPTISETSPEQTRSTSYGTSTGEQSSSIGSQSGGDPYLCKYYKYKAKYLFLKSKNQM
jgi:hypothetical protein